LVIGAIIAVGILGNFIKPSGQTQNLSKTPEPKKQQMAKKMEHLTKELTI